MATKRYPVLLTLAELDATLYALENHRTFGRFPVAQRRARDAAKRVLTFAKLDQSSRKRKPHSENK